jgi:hypothetical protein
MRRNGNFPPLRETATVAVTDGGEVESVGVFGEGGIGGHLGFELGDGNANDGGGELRRVDHHGVVLVVVVGSSSTLSVNGHGGVGIPRLHRCPDPLQPLNTLIQRNALELVHELVGFGGGLARLGGEEVGAAGGVGGLLSLALCLEGGGRGRLGRLLFGEFPGLGRGSRGGKEAVGHGLESSSCVGEERVGREMAKLEREAVRKTNSLVSTLEKVARGIVLLEIVARVLLSKERTRSETGEVCIQDCCSSN